MSFSSLRLALFALALPLWFASERPVAGQVIEAEAIGGSPWGVGRLVVMAPRPADAEQLIRDDRVSLSERGGRALYPVVEPAPVRRVLRRVFEIEGPARVSVYFLFRGTEPLELTLHTPQPFTVTVRPRAHDRLQERHTQAWWRHYTNDLRRLMRQDEYPPIVENYLAATLARRLRLELPRHMLVADEQGELGHAISLLTGAESARLRTARDLLTGVAPSAPADLPLPAPIALPEAVVPEVVDEVPIEPIALRVPQECFYVRFGNFDNYLWLREFLEQFGGDLRNMLSLRGLDYGHNDRLQRQIALRESALARVLGPAVISDVAMIGFDFAVEEGAAFGILFEARNNVALSSDFHKQREDAARREKDRGARLQKVEIAGREVSLLSTPDHQIRSYYAQHGDYHLVTTSETLVRRFIEASGGEGALGRSLQFQEARTLAPAADQQTVFVYLSEPFFAHLLSPKYRIEASRRLQASVEIELLKIARLAAQGEGSPARSVEELIAAGFLPASFGERPDGSRVVEDDDGRLLDSVRGAQGSFLPIPDVPVRGVSREESREYERLARQVSERLGAVDPLLVAIRREVLDKQGRERMTLAAHLIPYTAGQYDQVLRTFGTPTQLGMAPIAGDVVSAEVVTGGGGLLALLMGPQPHLPDNHLFFGLRDFTPLMGGGFQLLAPLGQRPELIRGYLGAWPDPGILGRLLRPEHPAAPPQRGLLPIAMPRLLHHQQGEFLLVSFKDAVLRDVSPQLEIVEYPRPAQIRLRVADLSDRQLAAGVNAAGYQRAQQVSAAGARFMNSLAEQLRVPRDECRDVAEDLLRATISCPLGGEYALVEYPGRLNIWASSALPPENRFDVKRVPDDYQLPLLGWFRGMEMDAALTDQLLSAHVEMEMKLEPIRAGIQLPTFPSFTLPKLLPDAPPPKQPEELPPPKPAPPDSEP